MSGRRRRDDGWDDRRDLDDDRRDPWADSSVDEWGSEDRGRGGDADWSGSSADASGPGGYAGYGMAGKGQPAPAFPSFQAADGGGQERGRGRYGAGSGYDTQRGGGYNGDGYADSRYGGRGTESDGYQDSGSGRRGYGASGYGSSSYGADGDSADGRYGQQSYRTGGYGNDPGYGGGAGFGGGNGRSGGPARAPEFTAIDNADADDDEPVGAARPIGRLSIYTLHNDRAREFDQLAERAAEGVRASEPDTLVYVIHVVPKAPMQRIIYEIYRDRAAYERHERQPHIRQFAVDRASCVLATNIIDLRLKYAKVTALGSAPAEAAPTQASRIPRTAEPQDSPPVASFTPAADRYAASNGQYAGGGRDQYPAASQYGNSGNGAYEAGNSQYGAANGYSSGGGYGNGGYSAANGYPSPNGYSSANGYSADNGYSGAGGYQSANGYQGANGYSSANGYSAANGYPNGSGYSNGSAYPNASGYSNGNGYSNGAGSGYAPASGYPDAGGATYSGASGGQYGQGRYRELPSGSSADAGASGYQDDANRYGDGGRRGSRPEASDWDQRSRQDQR